MVTAYDTPTAEILEEANVDFVLVGDSVGMVVLGYPSTTLVTMDEMIHHAKAVRRGVKKACVIGDLPLRGVEKGPAQALRSSERFLNEAGCDAVKLEWGNQTPRILKTLVRHRIPVLGHVGLTPQTVDPGSGFKVRGKKAEEAFDIWRRAKIFEENGAFAVLLECVPSPVAEAITKELKVPTIGIGAGPFCDGQVLVFHDLVGLFTRFMPRHVKRYVDARKMLEKAVHSFSREVRSRKFPGRSHGFSMDADELLRFKKLLRKEK